MNRTLLNKHAVTFAERPGVEFQIDEKEIGRGASCIVYHAVGSDNTEHLLKEYYPKHLELIRDDSGRILVPEDKQEAFEQGLDRFRAGCERQKSIRLSNEGLKNFTCNVQGYYVANGTEYIDMTCFNGQTYDHVQEQSVYNLMLRMRTLAQVVGNYHMAGLLHLDIKPENIYVRPENETIEDVMLFDFDSVIPMSDVCTAKALSCTKTWAAPEQLLPEKRRNICPATDLFAIGEIIFVQLFGRHSTSAERRSFVTKYAYNYDAEIFKDMNPKVFPLLDELLSHTICGVASKRYKSSEELIAKLDEIIPEASPNAPFIQPRDIGLNSECLGREEDIQSIHQAFTENNKAVFLCGDAGIGKSTLALAYANTFSNEYDAVVFLQYKGSLENLLLEVEIQNFDEESTAMRMKLLKKLLNERTLVIIDNFDVELDEDPYLDDLLQLQSKFIFTSRSDFSSFYDSQCVHLSVEGLSNNALMALFLKHSKHDLDKQSVQKILQLLSYYNRNTFLCELIARFWDASGCTIDELIDLLGAGIYSLSDLERVRYRKDGKRSKAVVTDAIKQLYNASNLSENRKCVLRNLCLLRYLRVNKRNYKELTKARPAAIDALNDMVDLGWVTKMGDEFLLHPLIEEITIEELSPNESNCAPLYESITDLAEICLQDYPESEQNNVETRLNAVAAFMAALPIDHDYNQHFILEYLSNLFEKDVLFSIFHSAFQLLFSKLDSAFGLFIKNAQTKFEFQSIMFLFWLRDLQYSCSTFDVSRNRSWIVSCAHHVNDKFQQVQYIVGKLQICGTLVDDIYDSAVHILDKLDRNLIDDDFPAELLPKEVIQHIYRIRKENFNTLSLYGKRAFGFVLTEEEEATLAKEQAELEHSFQVPWEVNPRIKQLLEKRDQLVLEAFRAESLCQYVIDITKCNELKIYQKAVIIRRIVDEIFAVFVNPEESLPATVIWRQIVNDVSAAFGNPEVLLPVHYLESHIDEVEEVIRIYTQITSCADWNPNFWGYNIFIDDFQTPQAQGFPVNISWHDLQADMVDFSPENMFLQIMHRNRDAFIKLIEKEHVGLWYSEANDLYDDYHYASFEYPLLGLLSACQHTGQESWIIPYLEKAIESFVVSEQYFEERQLLKVFRIISDCASEQLGKIPQADPSYGYYDNLYQKYSQKVASIEAFEESLKEPDLNLSVRDNRTALS